MTAPARSEVARAVVDRLSGDSARATVTVNNVTEHFSYPLPLDLVHRGGAWLVLTLPDDT